jgi:hypothetical protein
MRSAAAAAAILLTVGLVRPAAADNCAKSLDYLMNDLAGELPQGAEAYRNLLQTCVQTLAIDNVQDAYILRDGGIAVIPKQSSVLATAQTLAAFCRRFPRRTLRFITPGERRKGLTTGLVVLMSSTNTEPCSRIVGER